MSSRHRRRCSWRGRRTRRARRRRRRRRLCKHRRSGRRRPCVCNSGCHSGWPQRLCLRQRASLRCRRLHRRHRASERHRRCRSGSWHWTRRKPSGSDRCSRRRRSICLRGSLFRRRCLRRPNGRRCRRCACCRRLDGQRRFVRRCVRRLRDAARGAGGRWIERRGGRRCSSGWRRVCRRNVQSGRRRSLQRSKRRRRAERRRLRRLLRQLLPQRRLNRRCSCRRQRCVGCSSQDRRWCRGCRSRQGIRRVRWRGHSGWLCS